jgi:hypothetical protein
LAVVGVAIVELQGAGEAPTIGDALLFAQPIGFGNRRLPHQWEDKAGLLSLFRH